jgi:hypothetical protein
MKKGKQDHWYFLTFAILSYSDFVLVCFNMNLSIFSGNKPPFITLLISGAKFQSLGMHSSRVLGDISTCISCFTNTRYTIKLQLSVLYCTYFSLNKPHFFYNMQLTSLSLLTFTCKLCGNLIFDFLLYEQFS